METDTAQVETVEPQAAEPVAPAAEPQAGGVPPEVMQRLDDLTRWREEEVEPLLVGNGEPQYGEPGYEQPYGDPPGYQPGPEPQWAIDPATGQPVQVGPEPQWAIDPQTGQPVQVMPQGPDPQAIIEQRVQQAVGPLAQQLQRFTDERTNERLDALENEFPELKDEQAREGLVRDVIEFAEQAVEGLPEQQQAVVFERLRTNPDVVRRLYLARSARQGAAQGAPAGDPGAVLEAGSGANPGGGEDVPIQQQILTAGGGGHILG